MWLIIIGGIGAALFAIGFAQTGRMPYLIGIFGMGLLIAAVLAADHFVESDEERIESTLFTAAEAVDRNDIPAVIALLDPNKAELARRVQGVLSMFHFTSVKITDHKVRINKVASPPIATSHIVVRAAGGSKREGMRVEQGFVALDVDLVQSLQGWRITDYREVKVN